MPRILLHWDLDGAFHFLAEPGVEVVCVDERTPNDRVYLTAGDADPRTLGLVESGEVRDPIDAANRHGGA